MNTQQSDSGANKPLDQVAEAESCAGDLDGQTLQAPTTSNIQKTQLCSFFDGVANVPKMYPWQEELINDLTHGREIKLMMAGRRVGKSVFTAQAIKRLMDDLNNRPVEDLVLAESRFAGARYYTVEPIGGNWIEMERWCKKVFGDAAEVWDSKNPSNQFMWPEIGRWYMNNRKFWFREEKDRTMFVLRWR